MSYSKRNLERDPRLRNEPDIPDNLTEAIRVLEDKLSADIEELDRETPDPLAPLSLQIAHSIARARAAADGSIIEVLREQTDKKDLY